MNKQTIIIPLVASLSACSHYDASHNGFVVKTDDGTKGRLEVFTDNIVRVSATPEKNFAADSSLIIVPQSSQATFAHISEIDSTVVGLTAQLCVTVNKHSGQVSFSDLNGQPILSEDARTFAPISAEGKNGLVQGLSYRQVWYSADDEAFYGLGQQTKTTASCGTTTRSLALATNAITCNSTKPFVCTTKMATKVDLAAYGLLPRTAMPKC